MRVLALTTRSPYPLFEGRALRTYNLLKELSRKHEIFLCTFLQSPEEVAGLGEMRAFCADVYAEPLYLESPRRELLTDLVADLFSTQPILATKYRRQSMMNQVRVWLRERAIELVHLDMLHLGEYVGVVSGLPTVLIEHNVEAVILERRIETERNPVARAYLRYQHRKLARYESKLCAQVDQVVTVSELDAQQLRTAAPTGHYTSVPNGVNADFFQTAHRPKKTASLVYVGGLSWFPNLDAIRHFTADILPRVASRIPDVSLTVVGKLPSAAVTAEFQRFPNVRFTGMVDDVRPFIDAAAAYVVPLRIGGGTRLKILDALAMGQALVSTTVGCEGLELTPGQHLLVADDPDAFADHVVRVLSDSREARRLGEAGCARVRSHYDWRSIAKVLDNVYSRAAAGHRGAVRAEQAT